ncbi:hypothetical protein [Humisphaera borealis]|uniref:Amino acid transport protein n=1 Tax=Humisphaera borealis TaxID=2807512 RepID=A0A7M2WWJ3_9BACT|nr:hypothetical protein [Humisphaera borealis]QOV89865.1 hypothetical protein IPV69_00375 [Humisphaera borealis]
MDMGWLMLSSLFSMIGLGMFMYGKKAPRIVPLVAGLLLMVVPYFLSSLLLMTVSCVLLMASPFILGNLE